MTILRNTLPWHEQGYLDNLQSELKWRMFEATNLERKKNKLSDFKKNLDLERFAEYYARDMAKKHYIAHTTPEGQIFEDRINHFLFNTDYSYGENIAWYKYFFSFVIKKSVESLTEGLMGKLMNSQVHRENILSKEYNLLGIGAAYSREDKRVIVLQEFGGIYVK